MSTYFCILTNVGAAKLANATALGQTLSLSKMALGDGGGSLPTPDQAQTSLVNEVRRELLNSVTIDDDNPNWIVCEQVIPADEGGWTIRETGLYDEDGDLVAVGNFPETYKPVLEEGSGRTQTIRMVIQVSNAATVTLKIDPAVVLATREYVDQKNLAHVEAENPHPQYQTKVDAAEAGGETADQIDSLSSDLSSANLMINALKLQLSNNFSKMITSEPAYQMDAGALKIAADLGVAINGDFYQFDEGTGLVLPGSMSLGTDYAIYATPDGLVVSANFTVPDGYTALTSRRIGGFHHQNGEINEYSIYDLKYKPSVHDPRAMVRSPMGIWGDIYLLNTSPDLLGTSAYNATIADGSSPPKIPAIWGGDGAAQYDDFSQYTASRVLAAFGKRLPDSHEFEQLAFGGVAGYVVGADPVTTKFDTSAKSMVGCEQVSGHMWQWGSERWDRGNGSSGYNWYAADTNGEGQVYTAGSAGVGASRFGGGWTGSGIAGSRASYWYGEPWHSNEFISARGVCDHFESC